MKTRNLNGGRYVLEFVPTAALPDETEHDRAELRSMCGDGWYRVLEQGEFVASIQPAGELWHVFSVSSDPLGLDGRSPEQALDKFLNHQLQPAA